MASTTSTSPQPRRKLSESFKRVITFRKPTKSPSHKGFCLQLPNDKLKNSVRHFNKQLADDAEVRNRAAIDAFVAKLFGSVSSLKAAYAELQEAQFPYDGEGVKRADQSVVDELKTISELKRSFMKKQISASPPHVTLLLTEIQEQQSFMRMYQVTMSKMEKQIKTMNEKIHSLQKTLSKVNESNRVMEIMLQSERCFSLLDGIDQSDLTVTNFIEVLHYALASVQDFVKALIHNVQGARWDINVAVRAIAPDAIFQKTSHKCFAFESYITREIFEGFDSKEDDEIDRLHMFNQFKKLKSLSTIHILEQNPRSSFAKFTRAKYMRVVHPKMEFSLFGNLSQRRTLNTWQFPETEFFGAFAEMARRVWILRCLFLSFSEEVSVFRMREGARFSDVYMENVVAREVARDIDGGIQVAFTVVPGFKIGKQVVQSQVYLSPAGGGSGR